MNFGSMSNKLKFRYSCSQIIGQYEFLDVGFLVNRFLRYRSPKVNNVRKMPNFDLYRPKPNFTYKTYVIMKISTKKTVSGSFEVTQGQNLLEKRIFRNKICFCQNCKNFKSLNSIHPSIHSY